MGTELGETGTMDPEMRAPVDPSIGPVSAGDLATVTQLLGRTPKTAFDVVVRRRDGVPVVTRNAPFEHDGTPMPTRYWLLPSARANDAIGRLEAGGGVRAVEAEVSATEIAAAHESYARERSSSIPSDWVGPRPSGGVGGTRVGTKCLHAHYAYFLAGGPDPVGRWVWDHLAPHQRDEPLASLSEERSP
jgi:uncharacterized protein